MGNTPVLKPSEVVAILFALGFSEVRQRGSHKQFRNETGKCTTVPFHVNGGRNPSKSGDEGLAAAEIATRWA